MSVSIGAPGATLNLGKRGVRATAGIPGSGFSYSQILGKRSKSIATIEDQIQTIDTELKTLTAPFENDFVPAKPDNQVIHPVVDLTSFGLLDFRDQLQRSWDQRRIALSEKAELEKRLHVTLKLLEQKSTSPLRFLTGWKINKLREEKNTIEQKINSCKKRISAAALELDFDHTYQTHALYHDLLRRFEILAKASAIWDVTSVRKINQVAERSSASISYDRIPVKFDLSETDLMLIDNKVIEIGNSDGLPIFVFPGFVALKSDQGSIAIIDLQEIELNVEPVRFGEEDEIPQYSEVVGSTWAKVNKQGGPDRRFLNNYEITICRYAEMRISTRSGLYECFLLSNYRAAHAFGLAFENYQKALTIQYAIE
jgi:hypothetical protein